MDSLADGKLKIAAVSCAEQHSGVLTECGQVFMCGHYLSGKLGFEHRNPTHKRYHRVVLNQDLE